MRTCPSLKALHQEKVERKTNNLGGKEKGEATQEFQKKMHGAMDDAFKLKDHFFQEHAGNKDTTNFWRLWSNTQEDAWIQALGIEK